MHQLDLRKAYPMNAARQRLFDDVTTSMTIGLTVMAMVAAAVAFAVTGSVSLSHATRSVVATVVIAAGFGWVVCATTKLLVHGDLIWTIVGASLAVVCCAIAVWCFVQA